MDITFMSDQALIDELLSPGQREPFAQEARPCVRETTLAWTQVHHAPRLRRILDLARELLMRDLRRDWQNRPMVDSPAAFRDWLRLRVAHLEHEVFLVIFLDAHHRILDAEVMFRGTLTQTSVYPREVVKAALLANASAVIFAHNHPSGMPEPSQADRLLTDALRSALTTIDIRVLDHIIVAGPKTTSFAERGWL